jgi:hypothetical protein
MDNADNNPQEHGEDLQAVSTEVHVFTGDVDAEVMEAFMETLKKRSAINPVNIIVHGGKDGKRQKRFGFNPGRPMKDHHVNRLARTLSRT